MAEVIGEKVNCSLVWSRQAIARAFPVIRMQGVIQKTPLPPEAFDSLLEYETNNLNIVLSGASWPELIGEFVESGVSEYVFMTPAAVCAFLAAWLWHFLDVGYVGSITRDSLVFHLSKHGESNKATVGLWTDQFSSLTNPQRTVMYDLLQCISSEPAFYQEIDKEQYQEALACMRRHLTRWE